MTRNIEDIIAQALGRANDDRYLLSKAVAKRANQLADGAKPLVEVDKRLNKKYSDIALLEIAEGKIAITLNEM